MAEQFTAEDVFTAEDLDFEDVTISKWKKNGMPMVLRVREMNAERLLAFNDQMDKPGGRGNGMFVIIAYTVTTVDSDALMFTPDDIPKLRKKSFAVLDMLQRVALRINKLGKHAEEKLKNDSSEAGIDALPSVSQ